ncbi:MAG: hypothetical protein Q4F70_04090, partial [Clostridia bacterium]|nr:hypothetical protein [Clostridia bacterium]
KPPVSAPASSTKNSTINSARSSFESKLAGTDGESMSLKDIAVACSNAAGNRGNVTKITSGSNILGQRSVNGFDECYRFTAQPSVNLQRHYIAGYVFKVTSVSAEDFANSLYNNTKSSEGFTGTVGSTSIKYKSIDYYGDYVFYMISTY